MSWNELFTEVMNFRVDDKVDVEEIFQLKGSGCPRGLENASVEYVQWEVEWIFFSHSFEDFYITFCEHLKTYDGSLILGERSKWGEWSFPVTSRGDFSAM